MTVHSNGLPGIDTWAAARGITPTLAKRASALAAGLTAVKNNTADCIIMIAGDSTSVGYAYGDAGSNTNAALWNPAAYLAERLRQLGIPASTDAWMGTQVRTSDAIADVALFDPRRTFGTGWAIGTAKCAGGRTVRKASATAGACSYTPYSTCDRVDIIYAGNSGAYTANFDGGTATT